MSEHVQTAKAHARAVQTAKAHARAVGLDMTRHQTRIKQENCT